MTDSDTDPTRRALTLVAARTSDAGAALLTSLTGMGRSIRAARAAGVSVGGIGRELIKGRARARHHRAQNRIRPAVRLAAHSEEVIAAAAASGLTDVRVFGSCARGTDTLASDVDLIVKISEGTSLFDTTRFAIAVEGLLGLAEGRVDVVTGDALRPGSASGDHIAAEMQPLADWAAGLLRIAVLPAAVGRFERLAIALAAWRGTAEAYADPGVAVDGSDLDYLDE